jgi:hypothetical protein
MKKSKNTIQQSGAFIQEGLTHFFIELLKGAITED